MSDLYDVLIGGVLILAAFSPVFFLVALNSMVVNERGGGLMDRNIFDEVVHTTGEWRGSFHAPVVVQRDLNVLNSLRRMEVTTRGTKAHQTWLIKLKEYERSMRWNNAVDRSMGHHPH